MASDIANQAWAQLQSTMGLLGNLESGLDESFGGDAFEGTSLGGSSTGPTLRQPDSPAWETVPDRPDFDTDAAPGYTKDSRPFPGLHPITSFTGKKWTFPGKPSGLISPVDPNLDPHTIKEIDFPGKPDLDYGTAPEIRPVNIPSAPGLSPVPWEGPDIPPSDDLGLPDGSIFSYEDVAAYTSTLLTQIGNKLSDIVINGGTGLAPDVEQAIYDRAFLRHQLEKDRRVLQVYDQIAGRGFNLPTGVLASQLTEIENEFTRQLQEVNMDILVKQAELAQQNTHHAHQLSVQLEQLLIQNYDARASRLFEIAKTEYQYLLEYHKHKLEVYNARMQGYMGYAQAYKHRIEAQLVQLEEYKIRIEGEKVKVDVNVAEISAYAEYLKGVGLRVEVFKTEVEAAQGELQNELAMVEAYKTQYQAYQTRVDAYKSGIEAWGTEIATVSEEIKGERLKLDSELAINQNILSERDQLLKEKMQAIEEYKTELIHMSADIDRFKTEYDAHVTEIQALQQKETFELERWKADIGLSASEFDSEMRKFAAENDRAVAQAGLDIEQIKSQVQMAQYAIHIEMEKMKALANMSAQVAASALGAVNASASLGFSESNSASFGEAFSQSYSDSRSDSRDVSLNISDSTSV